MLYSALLLKISYSSLRLFGSFKNPLRLTLVGRRGVDAVVVGRVVCFPFKSLHFSLNIESSFTGGEAVAGGR